MILLLKAWQNFSVKLSSFCPFLVESCIYKENYPFLLDFPIWWSTDFLSMSLCFSGCPQRLCPCYVLLFISNFVHLVLPSLPFC